MIENGRREDFYQGEPITKMPFRQYKKPFKQGAYVSCLMSCIFYLYHIENGG